MVNICLVYMIHFPKNTSKVAIYILTLCVCIAYCVYMYFCMFHLVSSIVHYRWTAERESGNILWLYISWQFRNELWWNDM